MKCPHCNQEHPNGFHFCPITGKIIELLKACTLNPKCPDHGKHILPIDSLFCPTCGCKLDVTAGVDYNDGPKISFSVRGVSLKMILVEGGVFKMGSISSKDQECPFPEVTLSSFYIGETPVTQELWQAVMGRNPSRFNGAQKPVESVSWYDCQEFMLKLNLLTGKTFRLPTEAEWEYAARGGTQSEGYEYSGSNIINEVAWYNSSYGTHPVKEKSPNELGIYDMSGNVFEWCQDWRGSYTSSSQTNPTGPTSGSLRVRRGGCWQFDAMYCRVSYRDDYAPDETSGNLGFRLALSE